MKTIQHTLLIILLIFLSITTFAQLQFGGKLGIGGATQSELGDICHNTDLRLSYNAGITVKNQFNEWFALKTDLLFSSKGSSCDLNADRKTREITNNLEYFMIPVKAEFSAPVNNSKLIFATGPYAGFLLSANQEINSVSTDIKDETKNTDFGLAMELGFIQPLSKFDLVFSLNYDMGISEVFEFENDIQNKALTFNIGVLF